ncbi:ATP-grasp domain-containing protein [Clostridium sp.]|uniref:ATP-grasp domain-containing protein n=1 Tax=Clostridium sp. TaxID=1506 RepID=UPI00262699E2|nr:ATP-grasp domain-containing protein [Clostridium sp.]
MIKIKLTKVITSTLIIASVLVLNKHIKEVQDNSKEDIIVSYVDDVRIALYKYNIITPEIDYPEELKDYLGRKVWKTKLSVIANNPEKWSVFKKNSFI